MNIYVGNLSYKVRENDLQGVIEEYHAFGGGRTPSGICGALFSAEKLLSQAGKSGITTEFNTLVGETHCLAIKTTKFPCIDCVRIADELLEKKMK